MVENRDERARDELEGGLLSPPQELLPIIEDLPLGTVDAYEIKASNVISGFQHIEQQVVISDETLPSNVLLPTRTRKPVSSAKLPPFFLPPHDITFFTGRENELKQLEKLLLNETGPRIAGIVGLTGGTGKSALACHFATIYRDRFPDGVIGLRVDGKQIDALARRFAYLAGVEIDPQQGLTASEIMQLAFRDKQALLIFDNVEEATFHALHPSGAHCAVIVTTRDRELLRSFGVPDYAYLDLGRFTYQETLSLLQQLLGEQRVNAELSAVEDIHNLVGGLPLALRLIGGLLSEQSLTLNRYAEMWHTEKERLYQRNSHDPELDIYTFFALSFGFLDAEQQTLLACLGACAPEGFTLQIAQVVSQQSEDVAGRGLERLCRLSLLNAFPLDSLGFGVYAFPSGRRQESMSFLDPLEGTAISKGAQANRFVFHPLLFLFARALARERSLLAVAEQRHTDYFIKYAHEHHDLAPENLDALEQELDALLLTARRLTNDGITDYDYYLALEPFIQTNGFWSQGLELVHCFLQVASTHNDHYAVTQFLLLQAQFLQLLGRFAEAEQALQECGDRALQIENVKQREQSLAMVLSLLGGVYQWLGRFGEAIGAFRQCVDIERNRGNQRGQAMVLSLLGSVYQRQGRLDEAVGTFQECYAILKGLGDERGQVIALNSLGGGYQRQGRFAEAVGAFQDSYAVATKLGDGRSLGMVLNSLGGVYQRQGRFDLALDAFQKSLDLGTEPLHRAVVLNSLGGVYQRQGRFDDAERVFQEGHAISTKLGDKRGQAMVLNSLGGVYQRQGRFDQAIEAFQASLTLGKDIVTHKAMVLNSLGGVYQRQGRFDDAVEVLRQSADIEQTVGNQRGHAMVLNSLGGVYQRQGRFAEAVGVFLQSRAIAIKLGDERSLAMVLTSLGGVYQRQGRFDEAVDAFQQSYAISAKLDDGRSLAMVLNSLGGVYQRQGRFDDAVEVFQQSRAISAEMDDEHSLAMVLNSLGGVYQRQGKFDKAVEAFQQSHAISAKLGDEYSLAMVLNSLGGVYQRQGRFGEAVEAFQESHAILTRLDDERGQAMVLNSLGGVYQRQGKFDEAVRAFQESRGISTMLGDERSLAMVLNSLGGVYQRQGKFGLAIDAFQKSLDLGKEVPTHKAMVLHSLGGVYQRQGRFDEAVDAFQESHALLIRLGDERGQAMVLNSLGGVYQRQNRVPEAVVAFRQSRAISTKLGDKRSLAMVLTSLGGVYQRQGKFDLAVEVLRQSADIEQAIGNERGQAMVLTSLGGVYQRQGRFALAVEVFQQSHAILAKLGDERGQAMVLNSLGGGYQRQGRFDEAVDAFQESRAISTKLGDERSLGMVLNSLGGAYQRQGRLDLAVEVFQQSLDMGKETTHRAMVLSSWGRALLDHGQPWQAIEKLKASFAIEEHLRVTSGLRIVSPLLVQALIKVGQHEDAQHYCRRALAVTPNDKRLLRLLEHLTQAPSVSAQASIKSGQIKRIVHHPAGYLYGFITPDDRSADIYFGENQVDTLLLPLLREGLYVTVDVEMTGRGPRACRVWGDTSYSSC